MPRPHSILPFLPYQLLLPHDFYCFIKPYPVFVEIPQSFTHFHVPFAILPLCRNSIITFIKGTLWKIRPLKKSGPRFHLSVGYLHLNIPSVSPSQHVPKWTHHYPQPICFFSLLLYRTTIFISHPKLKPWHYLGVIFDFFLANKSTFSISMRKPFRSTIDIQ